MIHIFFGYAGFFALVVILWWGGGSLVHFLFGSAVAAGLAYLAVSRPSARSLQGGAWSHESGK